MTRIPDFSTVAFAPLLGWPLLWRRRGKQVILAPL
jgi:hypothetical protein